MKTIFKIITICLFVLQSLFLSSQAVSASHGGSHTREECTAKPDTCPGYNGQTGYIWCDPQNKDHCFWGPANSAGDLKNLCPYYPETNFCQYPGNGPSLLCNINQPDKCFVGRPEDGLDIRNYCQYYPDLQDCQYPGHGDSLFCQAGPDQVRHCWWRSGPGKGTFQELCQYFPTAQACAFVGKGDPNGDFLWCPVQGDNEHCFLGRSTDSEEAQHQTLCRLYPTISACQTPQPSSSLRTQPPVSGSNPTPTSSSLRTQPPVASADPNVPWWARQTPEPDRFMPTPTPVSQAQPTAVPQQTQPPGPNTNGGPWMCDIDGRCGYLTAVYGMSGGMCRVLLCTMGCTEAYMNTCPSL